MARSVLEGVSLGLMILYINATVGINPSNVILTGGEPGLVFGSKCFRIFLNLLVPCECTGRSSYGAAS